MLQHLTKVLHPGVLNDCFHQEATAVCARRAKPLGGRPLPMLNMCSICPNSRRTSVHLPRLIAARDQAQAALDVPGGLPPLQKTVIDGYVTSFDKLITDLQPEEPTRA